MMNVVTIIERVSYYSATREDKLLQRRDDLE